MLLNLFQELRAEFECMGYGDWKSDEAWDAVLDHLKFEATKSVTGFEDRREGMDSSIDTFSADALPERTTPENGTVKIVDTGIYSICTPARNTMRDVCVPECLRFPTRVPCNAVIDPQPGASEQIVPAVLGEYPFIPGEF